MLVLQTTATRITGNPTLTSIDGEERCTFGSIRDSSPERLAEFGVYDVDTTPPEGQRWTGQFDGTVTPPVAVFEEMPAPQTPEEILASLPSVSHAQMIAALVIHSVITEAEGEAWLLGTLPDDVLTVISSLPPEAQFVAKLRAIRPSEVSPRDILVPALAAMKGKTTEDLIQIFQLAATL